jgi:hypothetical protein
MTGAEVRLCNMVLRRSLSNITIVIVEDHSDTLFFLTQFLNREGLPPEKLWMGCCEELLASDRRVADSP